MKQKLKSWFHIVFHIGPIYVGFKRKGPKIQRNRGLTEDIRIAIHNVFSDWEGQAVLGYLLSGLGFFSEALNDEERALKNFAIRFLNESGIVSTNTIPEIVESLMKIQRDTYR